MDCEWNLPKKFSPKTYLCDFYFFNILLSQTTVFDVRCLVVATTAERFFRIDRAQEHLHYVTDISSEDLYILDPDLHVSFTKPNLHNNNNHLTTLSPMTSQHGSISGEMSPGLTPPVIVQDMEDGGVTVHSKFNFNMPTPPKSPHG